MASWKDEQSFRPEDTPMDVLNRVLANVSDNIDRIVIITMDAKGTSFSLHSNCRSGAEEKGMSKMAADWGYEVENAT